MTAFMVFDGGNTVHVPPEMGEPCDDQLAGTVGEQVIELATRVCYDSLGLDAKGKRKGRSTVKTLANVLDVKHGSVLEHYTLTVEMRNQPAAHMAMPALLNRPGIFTRFNDDNGKWRITTNVRAVVEWDKWSAILEREHGDGFYPKVASNIGNMLRRCFSAAVPHLVSSPGESLAYEGTVVEPATDAERWVSMYLVGSRGFSHEMVRHRFAISQRSTRYCGESGSEWHWHPTIMQYIAMNDGTALFSGALREAQATSEAAYGEIVGVLEDWLLGVLPKDIPYRKKHARKQARGAARGFLGNALETQMVFSAPVWAWKHIVNMRAADAADAEIRVVIAEVASLLKLSRYADRFEGLKLAEASDGIGLALVGGGHD